MLAEGEYKDVVVVVLLVVVSISLFKLLTVEKGDYETCYLKCLLLKKHKLCGSRCQPVPGFLLSFEGTRER